MHSTVRYYSTYTGRASAGYSLQLRRRSSGSAGERHYQQPLGGSGAGALGGRCWRPREAATGGPVSRKLGTRGKPPGCEKGAPRPVPTAMHIGTRVFRSCASPPPPPPGRAVDPFTQPPPRPGLDGLASCPVGLRPPAPRARSLAACPARDRRGSRAPHRRPVVLASRYIIHPSSPRRRPAARIFCSRPVRVSVSIHPSTAPA